MTREYEYVIRIDGKEVWRGKHPKNKFLELKKKNPEKRVSVAWESDDDIVIVFIEALSKHGLWCGIDKVLVDTGADITLLPRDIGEILVDDIATGEIASVKGLGPNELKVFIHSIKLRVADKEFETKVAIADSDEAPAVLGRFEALDFFDAKFVKGKELVLER